MSLLLTPTEPQHVGDTANTAWLHLGRQVMHRGSEHSPRDQKTMELIGFRSVVNMRYPMMNIRARKLGYKFMAAEAAWIISGSDDVASIAPYSRDISRFSDDGEKFFGAYGPKVEKQIDYVLETLGRDPSSRQAVINIWRENPPPSKDIPCTISVQWFIRGNYLYCVDTMRSSDVWLGWPYDIFNFSMLSAYILLHLRRNPRFKDLELGWIVLNAGSQHVYERNWDDLRAIISNFAPNMDVADVVPPFEPHKWFKQPDELLSGLWAAAKGKGAQEWFRSKG